MEYIIGSVYGIVELVGTHMNEKGRLMADVICIDCGRRKILRASDLYNKKQTSCICKLSTHNQRGSKIYSIYHNMKYRCYNSNCHAFKDYGGKGVSICDEWMDAERGFVNFYNWSMDNGYKEGLSIDRIESNGNYDPNNCRWVTLSSNVAYANKENVRRKADKGVYYGISPDGKYFEFDNAAKFARENSLHSGCVRACANGSKKTHKKWIFGFINEK